MEGGEEGLGQVEMQQAEAGPLLGGYQVGPQLGALDPPVGAWDRPAKPPVFQLHAVAGGLLPADIKAYRPPVLDDRSATDTNSKSSPQ